MSRRAQIRMKRRINRLIIKLSFVAMLAFLCCGIFGIVKSYAGTDKAVPSGYDKVFVSTQIRYDNDIFKIAEANLPEGESVDSYLAEVSRINHIRDLTGLDCGDSIIVPVYRQK